MLVSDIIVISFSFSSVSVCCSFVLTLFYPYQAIETLACSISFFLAHASTGSSSIGPFIGGSVVSAASPDIFGEGRHDVGQSSHFGEAATVAEFSEEKVSERQ